MKPAGKKKRLKLKGCNHHQSGIKSILIYLMNKSVLQPWLLCTVITQLLQSKVSFPVSSYTDIQRGEKACDMPVSFSTQMSTAHLVYIAHANPGFLQQLLTPKIRIIFWITMRINILPRIFISIHIMFSCPLRLLQ